MKHNRLSVAILLLFVTSLIYSKNLIISRQSSYHTYIYKITESEAETLNKKGIRKADSTMLHTLVAFFPTDSVYRMPLAPGHYLKTYSERNQQKILYSCVPDFEVMLQNNNTDLNIQVYDLRGKIVQDAQVFIRGKQLRFDPKTMCYVEKKSNSRGLLKVKRGGQTAWYELRRKKNNPLLKRAGVALIAETPLIYLWRPVNYIVRLPVDGVKSLIKGWPQGVIRQTNYFFGRLFSGNKNLHYTGYMVFSKPLYMPRDTVKFKTFLINKAGKPLEKEVTVNIFNGTKKIQLAIIKPRHPGAFDFTFPLHDSLNLILDRHYSVELVDKNGDQYISSSFKYEDYELNPTKLELRTASDKHFHGKKFSLFAKGTDDNGLNLQDARIEIRLTTKNIQRYFGYRLFVPDTLWQHQMTLKPAGETEIILPDSIFPNANLSYQAEVRMLTSDNKSFVQSKQINYTFQQKGFEFLLINDSIKVVYNENGEEKRQPFLCTANDNFDLKNPLGTFVTPCLIPLNVFYAGYTASTDSLQNTTTIAGMQSLLQCFTRRTHDSLFITTSNPRKLHFAYNIYCRNKEIVRGSGTNLEYKAAANIHKNYYIALRYLWGGKTTEQTYRIPFRDKELKVEVKQPTLVYPGQNAEIQIMVTDVKGKPVPGVDLTAWSVTSKFNYQPPTLPYSGKKNKEKVLINNFSLDRNGRNENTSIKLNYLAWKMLAGIDSIEYYRFAYPGRNIYRYEYQANDSITQFAPFVVDSRGQSQTIHVVYLDNLPVYFGWSNNISPYSFRVSPGQKHQLKIRLSDKQITLKDITFKAGMKTILSIPDYLNNDKCSIEKRPEKFSNQEAAFLQKFIFQYRNNFGENIAYLRDKENISLLNSENTLHYVKNYAGPIAGNLKAGIYKGYSLNFGHEPGFDYELAPELLKMRTVDSKDYPTSNTLTQNVREKPFAGFVLTEKDLERLHQEMKDNRRRNYPSYKNPQYTTSGYGKLLYQQDETLEKPLNKVMLKPDEPAFVRIYNERDNSFQQLKPGYYQLIRFFTGSRYCITDSVEVKANGTNYFREEKLPELKKDAFGQRINDLIEKSIYESGEKTSNAFLSEYLSNNAYTGEGVNVSGRILEQGSNEPVIGASILVKGTKYGTISNLNGDFSMKIPTGHNFLTVNFIGYEQQLIDVNAFGNSVIYLKPDMKALDEVVVVGYGSQKKQLLTGSIASISIDGALQGRLAGVTVGSGNDIRIRGASSVDGKSPLIIVNGMVYTGSLDKLDPSLVSKMMVLKEAEATSIYGSAGANGVILIDSDNIEFTTGLKKDDKGAQFDDAFLEASSKASSLRSNFSDLAYWQPQLMTDREGMATFRTTFPDDVTNWQTMVLAMNGKRQSGQTYGNIKSYKPLMAQLAVPNILTEGDTCRIIGKTLNYLPDSVFVKSVFAKGKNAENKLLENEFNCKNAHLDTLVFVAPVDTTQLQYSIFRKDGYFDGEKREIPVMPVGLEETRGHFHILDRDTILQPVFDPLAGPVTLYADASELDVVQHEISKLKAYRYECNEQLASKLKALLANRIIAEYSKEKFRGNAEVEKIIRLLLKNRRSDGWWGWWPGTEMHLDFSRHALEALTQARRMGYKVDMNETTFIQSTVWKLENELSEDADRDISLLQMLKEMDAKVDFAAYMEKVDSLPLLTITQSLKLDELKLRCGMKVNTDYISKHKRHTIFGNVYYHFDEKNSRYCSNDIAHTLHVYRILRAEHAPDSLLRKIRRYFMETKQGKAGWNTWETAQIIETILPDILKDGNAATPANLKISGDRQETISIFPFSKELQPTEKISISKKGGQDLYLTTYQRTFNPKPWAKSGDFVISTTFDNKAGTFEAGKPVKLIVTLEVRKEAGYVMLNIPIPGGFSYENKTQSYRYNEYREYFKQQTNIYCEHLTEGKYRYEISLIPRFGGIFTLNPAKVELMYFPVFNANNEMKRVRVN